MSEQILVGDMVPFSMAISTPQELKINGGQVIGTMKMLLILKYTTNKVST